MDIEGRHQSKSMKANVLLNLGHHWYLRTKLENTACVKNTHRQSESSKMAVSAACDDSEQYSCTNQGCGGKNYK